MLQVTEETFDAEVKEGLVIVDFYAPWCAPCRFMVPILERLEGAKIVKVDVDQEQNLATKYRVSAIPKLMFFKDGVEVFEMLGVYSQEAIQEKIDKFNR